MIRRMEEQELSSCLMIIRQSFATVTNEFGLTSENCPTNGAFMPSAHLEREYRKGKLMYVYDAGGKLVGFMQLAKKEDGVYELEKLAVLPEYRHRGYGAQLIHFAIQQVKAWGGCQMTIGIIEENNRLRDWYIRQGFSHIGTKVLPHLPFTVGLMVLSV